MVVLLVAEQLPAVPGHRLTNAAVVTGNLHMLASQLGSVDTEIGLAPVVPPRPVTEVQTSPPGRPFQMGMQHQTPEVDVGSRGWLAAQWLAFS